MTASQAIANLIAAHQAEAKRPHAHYTLAYLSAYKTWATRRGLNWPAIALTLPGKTPGFGYAAPPKKRLKGSDRLAIVAQLAELGVTAEAAKISGKWAIVVRQ